MKPNFYLRVCNPVDGESCQKGIFSSEGGTTYCYSKWHFFDDIALNRVDLACNIVRYCTEKHNSNCMIGELIYVNDGSYI